MVNLASMEYRSITEKFKGVFIKLMDFRIILTKSRVFLQNSWSTARLPKVQGFNFKKLNYKKSGGIFVKLVDCGGYLVNLASTEYRSITEKFKGFFIKLMDFRIILTKSRVFFIKFTKYGTITKSLGFFCKVRLHEVRGVFH